MEDIHIGQYIIPIVVVIAALLIGVAIWSQNGAPLDAPVEREQVGQGSLPALGADSAPVQLVVFSDFDCSFCGRFAQDTLGRLANEFGKDGTLAIYWRDFPFLADTSLDAANAARCAAEQDAFWPYHDRLFARPEARTRAGLVGLAGELGLAEAQFSACLDGRRYQQDIVADTEAARALSIQGAPTVFIGPRPTSTGLVNAERIVGAQPYKMFRNAVFRALAE